MEHPRAGFAAAVGAYVLWGLFPLYWPLLEPAAPVEILAHRIVWSLVFLIALLAPTMGFRWVTRLGWRRAGPGISSAGHREGCQTPVSGSRRTAALTR